MKYKKYSYIIVFILMLIVGINKTYANYMSYNETLDNERLIKYNIKKTSLTPIDNDTGEGTPTNVNCETLFGDKNDPESIRYLINEILEIPRIVVPILIILMGTIDMATAVISPKEDGMKTAQTKFIKRLVIGVAIFFVPTIVDILMYLADIVWAGTGYTSCGI